MAQQPGISRRNALRLAASGALSSLAGARPSFAQPGMRTLGSLRSQGPNDPSAGRFTAALDEGLRSRGWIDGVNLRIETRWTLGVRDLSEQYSKELADLAPDVLLAYSAVGAAEMVKVHGQIPMVFGGVSDPVEQGLVTNLARPGGLVTGFMSLVPTLGGKWVELLHDLAPELRTVGILYNPETAPGRGTYFLPSFEAASAALGLDWVRLPVVSPEEMITSVRTFAEGDRPGLVVMSDSFLINNRLALIAEVAELRLPAVYGHLLFGEEGGLLSYGIDPYEPMRGAGTYVGRILNGEAPGDLPVTGPSVFFLSINRRLAAELGLAVPLHLLAQADRIID